MPSKPQLSGVFHLNKMRLGCEGILLEHLQEAQVLPALIKYQ